MNSWNFNEITQQDVLDFKACKHNKTGKIYGIKDSSDCQSGKEIDTKDINEMVRKANKGDATAKKQLEEYRKAKAKGKQETAKEKEEQERKKKEAADPKKKKGKGGKGKKGGGKGKGGKGGKGAKGGKGGGGGGGKAAPATQKSTAQSREQVRQRQAESARRGVKALQDALGSIKNPKQRERIEKKIADLLESVAKLTMPNAPAPEAPQAQAPAQQQQPAKKENEKS